MASMIKMDANRKAKRNMAPAQKRPAKPGKPGVKKPLPMPKPAKPGAKKPVPMPKPKPRKPSGSMLAKKGAMPAPDAKAKAFVKRAKAYVSKKQGDENQREFYNGVRGYGKQPGGVFSKASSKAPVSRYRQRSGGKGK